LKQIKIKKLFSSRLKISSGFFVSENTLSQSKEKAVGKMRS